MLRGVRNMLEGGQKLRGGAAPPPEMLRGVRPDRRPSPEYAPEHVIQCVNVYYIPFFIVEI